MTITPALFAQAGEALFGPEWKRPLAQLLGMNERTVFRIAKAAREGEDYPVSISLAGRLHLEIQKALSRDAEKRETQQILVRKLYDVAVQHAIAVGENNASVRATAQQAIAERETELDERARALHGQCSKLAYDELPDDLRDAYRHRAKEEMEADGREFARAVLSGLLA